MKTLNDIQRAVEKGKSSKMINALISSYLDCRFREIAVRCKPDKRMMAICGPVPTTTWKESGLKRFKMKHYKWFRRVAYGTPEKQLEVMQEKGFDHWRTVYCANVKAKYPKFEIVKK